MDIVTIVFVALGIAAGVSENSLPIAVMGAVLGFLLSRYFYSNRLIDTLQQRIDDLQSALSRDWEQRQRDKPAAEPEPEPVSTDAQNEEPIPEPIVSYARVESPAAASKEEPRGSSPDLLDKLSGWVVEYFTGGNIFVRSGILVVFIGVAFLLKYASERTTVPIELRVLGVALGGIAALVLGWRLRHKRSSYALAMQGGGLGILYLSIFAAFRLYDIVPAGFAFALMLAVGLAAAALSVKQNTRALIILGVVGGFIAPILSSTGSGSHVQLFSYYLLINVGILAVAWFKAWRSLNLLGFVFTFVIGSVWGVMQYTPSLLWSTEPFLISLFLFYVAIAVLFTQRQSPSETGRMAGYVDGSLVFANPITCFFLQASMVQQYEYGLAWSAFAIGIFYLALTAALQYWKRDNMQRLQQSFLALGIFFTSLSVVFTFDGYQTIAIWAVEGAFLLWLWKKQQSLLGRLYAQCLQLAAALLFVVNILSERPVDAFLNTEFVGGVLIALSALWSAYCLQQDDGELKNWENGFSPFWLGFASLAWLTTWVAQLHLIDIDSYARQSCVLILISLSLCIYQYLGRSLNWPLIRKASYLQLPVVILFAVLGLIHTDNYLTAYGALAWPTAILAMWALLYCADNDEDIQLLPQQHFLGGISTLLILHVDWLWWLAELRQLPRETVMCFALLPSLLALGGLGVFKRWPLRTWPGVYQRNLGAVLAALIVLWMVLANASVSGDDMWKYIPVLNPLGLMLIASFFLLWRWWKSSMQALHGEYNNHFIALLMGLAFYSLNAVLLRCLHHYAGLAFDADEMYHSVLVQLSISVLWAVLGIAAMLLSTRRHWRPVWLAGAGLMGAVVLKLFAIDLGNSGTIERIVSFLVVGGVLMLIGYFSPMPPEQKLIQGEEG